MTDEDVLGGDPLEGGPGGPDELRRIVQRAGRRRWRVAVGGVVAALALGGGAGYLVASNTSAGQTVLASGGSSPKSSSATSSGATSAVAPAAVAGGSVGTSVSPGYSPLTSATLRRLFVRSAGDVTIRGFATTPVAAPATVDSCGPISLAPGFVAEVSSPAMVGTVESVLPLGSSPSKAIVEGVFAEQVGVAEGDPTVVVLVKTSPAVNKVVVKFSGGGTDSMTPLQGWSALADSATAPASGSVATVDATSASGASLEELPVSLGYNAEQTGGVGTFACCNFALSGGVAPGAEKPVTGSSAIACPLLPSHRASGGAIGSGASPPATLPVISAPGQG